MQVLYRGIESVGEIASDGVVYAVAGLRRQPVGAVADDGTVTLQGQAVGLVDASGNIFDRFGLALGSVDRRGQVLRYGLAFGSVIGENPLRGGAALLLLFGEQRQPAHVPSPQPPKPLHWAVPVIGLGLTVIVLLAVLAFVAVAAFAWFIWLLLSSL